MGDLFSKCQLSSSYNFGIKFVWRYFLKGSLTELMNQVTNDKGVFKTAPASRGLFRKVKTHVIIKTWCQGSKITCQVSHVIKQLFSVQHFFKTISKQKWQNLKQISMHYFFLWNGFLIIWLGEKEILVFHLNYQKKNITSITKPFGKTIDWFSWVESWRLWALILNIHFSLTHSRIIF